MGSQLSGFGNGLYDSKQREFLGRDGAGWSKLNFDISTVIRVCIDFPSKIRHFLLFFLPWCGWFFLYHVSYTFIIHTTRSSTLSFGIILYAISFKSSFTWFVSEK